MGLYEKLVLPRLLHLACGAGPITKQRQKVVPLAEGQVLEIGIGSGLNLPHYDASLVSKVYGLDPSAEMRAFAERAAVDLPFEVEFIGLPGDQIPLEDASIDTVVCTYTLCTIPDPIPALAGMRRVMKPGATLLFCEHGEAPDESVRQWQGRLNGIWGKLFGACNLNRDIPSVLAQGGFHVAELDEMYLPGTPGFAGYNYWGAANIA